MSFSCTFTQIQPGFSLSKATILPIVHICQQIAGMPLVIELATASVRNFPIAEIKRQISTNDEPPRHRSLRAVFNHSWKLLSEPERILLSRLAVFRGGWEQTAVEAICAQLARQRLRSQAAENVLPVASYTFSTVGLAALIDKSLVRRTQVENKHQPNLVPSTV